MNDQRIVALLNLLKQETGYISSQQLGSILGISHRTVRDTLRDLESEKCGIRIEMRPGKGVRLIVEDKKVLQNYLQAMRTKSQNLPSTNESRALYILRKFLTGSDRFFKYQDLIDELHVSSQVFSLSLKQAKEILSCYNLTLVSPPHYGMKIQGLEQNIRNCLSIYAEDYMTNQLSEIIPFDRLSHLTELVASELQNNEHSIFCVSLNRLIAQIKAILYRGAVMHYHPVPSSLVLDSSLHFKEIQNAHAILRTLENSYQLSFPDSEEKYLAVLLAADRVLSVDELSSSGCRRIYKLVDEIIDTILQTVGVDFRDETELRDNLAVHLAPMEVRLKNGLRLINPMIAEIQIKYAFAYNCASLAAGVLSHTYSMHVSDDETGYLALLFGLALERQNDVHRKNILVVCDSGQSTAKILMYDIQRHFARNIKHICTVNRLQLEDYDPREWDYIFTTVPLLKEYGIPTLLISPILEDGERMKIRSLLEKKRKPFLLSEFFKPELFFSDVHCETKNEVFDFLVERISKEIVLPECFKEYVLRREENGRTEFGSMLAIPHPFIPVTDTTFVAVAILRQPILWSQKKVQIIFLISPSRYPNNHTEQLFKIISQLLNNAGNVNKLIRKGDYDTLIDLLTKYLA